MHVSQLQLTFIRREKAFLDQMRQNQSTSSKKITKNLIVFHFSATMFLQSNNQSTIKLKPIICPQTDKQVSHSVFYFSYFRHVLILNANCPISYCKSSNANESGLQGRQVRPQILERVHGSWRKACVWRQTVSSRLTSPIDLTSVLADRGLNFNPLCTYPDPFWRVLHDRINSGQKHIKM